VDAEGIVFRSIRGEDNLRGFDAGAMLTATGQQNEGRGREQQVLGALESCTVAVG
jgi:hypothetical protein